jgi:maleamate amidohydrolase
MRRTTAEIYRAAGFGRPMRLGVRPAVIVVDLSYGFTDPACALGSDLADVVSATCTVIDRARQFGFPVAFTRIAYAADLSDAGIWLEKSPALAELRRGTRWTQLDARLGWRPGEPVVTKTGASAAFGTPLLTILAAWQRDSVVLCGATTSGCVRATAVDLLQAGYRTLIPRECVGDRAPGPHDSSLRDLDAKYVNVTSTDHALEYLDHCRQAGEEQPQPYSAEVLENPGGHER